MKINFSKRNLNIISFFISLIIFIIIIIFLNFLKINFSLSNTSLIPNVKNELNSKNNNVKDELNISNNTEEILQLSEIFEWNLEIEKINLNAKILEGIDESILKNSIGHYPNTDLLEGKVALKAYNIGENNNFFANLKELEIGDEINYIVNQEKNTYKVISNKIIDEENEKDLLDGTLPQNENWQENNDIIILITYVKDLPEKLRCVIATKNS